MWQPVGNHLPAMAMIRQGTPDRLEGISTKFGTAWKRPPDSLASLCQEMRKRFTGSTSHSPVWASLALIFSGMRSGFCIWAMVGMTMWFSRAFWMLCLRPSWLMVRSIMMLIPSYFTI